jgi:hypothetical protein
MAHAGTAQFVTRKPVVVEMLVENLGATASNAD